MKAFIKQQHCAHSHFKWLDFPWKRRLLTPRRAATQAMGWEMGWWVPLGACNRQQASEFSELRCQRVTHFQFSLAEIPLTHSSHFCINFHRMRHYIAEFRLAAARAVAFGRDFELGLNRWAVHFEDLAAPVAADWQGLRGESVVAGSQFDKLSAGRVGRKCWGKCCRYTDEDWSAAGDN